MPYKTINGCTHHPAKQQIIAITLYLTLIILHSIYIVPGIFNILNNQILIFLLVLSYLALAVIIYDYIWITVHDPVDTIVLDPELISSVSIDKLDNCQHCGKRQIDSYHCKRCGRCTQDFDHHCKFLNNCIGRKNYQKFLRLLSINVVYLPLIISQGIWVFVEANKFENKADGENKIVPIASYWVILIVIIISGFLLILEAILLGFHCYISCLDMTTLSFIKQQDNPQRSTRGQQKIKQDKLRSFRNSIIQYQDPQKPELDNPITSQRVLKQNKQNIQSESDRPNQIINDKQYR